MNEEGKIVATDLLQDGKDGKSSSETADNADV